MNIYAAGLGGRRGGGRSRDVGHVKRDDFGEAVQVRLRRIGARLGRWNRIKGTDVGEKRR